MRRTLGQFPVKRGKEKGPKKRDDTLYRPYHKPVRTPVSTENRPSLLPPPVTPPTNPDMDLNSIWSTLCHLVSQIERVIEKRASACICNVSGCNQPGSLGNIRTCNQFCSPDNVNVCNQPCSSIKVRVCSLPCTPDLFASAPPLRSRLTCGQPLPYPNSCTPTEVEPLPYPNSCTPTELEPHKSLSNRDCNFPRMPQEGLLNLSRHRLSVAEVSLLKKGLSFVPTPLAMSRPRFENALENLCHKYKNRFSLPNRSERLLDCSFEAIRYDLSRAEILQPEPYLTKAERLALHGLKKNKNIIITKADKGDTTVIMDTSHLIELAHKHLSDVNAYQLLKNDPTPEVVVKFNLYIQDCLARGAISQREHDRLHLPENTSTQTMYFLPKIRKCTLKVRPIVSCTNRPTCKASAFLDRLLQPHMKNTESYLKNSTQLVNILSNKKISANALLVTPT